MGDPYPGVPGDDIVLNGEDGAPVVMYPGHLVGAQPHHAAGQNHVPPLRHRHVLHRVSELVRGLTSEKLNINLNILP